MDSSPLFYLDNDGVVPRDSALYNEAGSAGRGVRRVVCQNHSHTELRSATAKACKDGRSLVDWVADDLGLVAGTAPAKLLEVETVSLDGGAVRIGASAQVTLRVRNVGQAPLQVGPVTFSGPHASEWAAGTALPFSLQPNAPADIAFVFRPTSFGARVARLRLSTDAENGPVAIDLTGRGIQPGCAATPSPVVGRYSAAAGTGSFALSAPVGCQWRLSSTASWLTLTSAATGSGSATVTFSCTAGLQTQRVAEIVIDNGDPQPSSFVVSQDGTVPSCAYGLSEYLRNVAAAGESGTLTVSAPTGCAWTAASDHPWLSILSGGTGSGTGQLRYQLAANTQPSTRLSLLRIAAASGPPSYFALNQAGAPQACTYAVAQDQVTVSAVAGSGTLSVTAGTGCRWQVSASPGWLTVNPPGYGTGAGTLGYAFQQNANRASREGTVTFSGSNWTHVVRVGQAGQSPLVADIDLPAPAVEFGQVLTGATLYQSVRIVNQSDGYLDIYNVYRRSGSTAFSVVAAPLPIPPRGEGIATIAFSSPTLGRATAEIGITSNDPDETEVIVSVGATAVSQTSGGIDFTWAERAPTPDQGSQVFRSRSAVIGSGIYVVGGSAPRRLYRYDATLDSWARLADAPAGINDGGVAAIGTRLYAVGDFAQNRVQIYDSGGGSWTLGAAMPTARQGLCAVSSGGRLYAIGGEGTGVVEEYDPVGDSWRARATMPTARGYAACAVVNGTIYVVGGMVAGGAKTNVVEAYDPVANTWSSREGMRHQRSHAAADAIAGKVYVAGGFDSSGVALAALEEFDPSLADANPAPGFFDAWFVRAPLRTARAEAVAGAVNGRLYAIGGLTSAGIAVTTVEEGTLNASPDINVPSTTVAFGRTSVGTVLEALVSVQNRGQAALSLTTDRVSGSTEFQLFRDVRSLGAGETGTLRFRVVAGSVGEKTAVWRITSNDPGTPTIDLALSASIGPAPVITGGSWQVTQTIDPVGSGGGGRMRIVDGRAFILRMGVSVVELATGASWEMTFPDYPFGRPRGVDARGNLAFVALGNLADEGQLAIVDLTTRQLVRYVPLAADPVGVAAGATDVLVTTVDPAPGKVAFVDTATWTVTRRIDAGSGPSAILVDAAVSRAFVLNRCPSCPEAADSDAKSVSVIDLVSRTVVATIRMPYFPAALAANDRDLFVATSGSLEVVNRSSNRRSRSIPLAIPADALALSPDRVFVAAGAAVVVLDANDGSCVTSVPVLPGPPSTISGIAFDAAAGAVWVADSATGALTQVRFVAPRFSLTCDRPVVGLLPGTVSAVPCAAQPLDGFSGDLGVGCTGVPGGAQCAASSPLISAEVGTAAPFNVLVSVPQDAVGAYYPVTITVSSGGVVSAYPLGVAVATCGYELSPASAAFEAAGGEGSVSIAATAGCSWTASSQTPWLSPIGGVLGSGSGSVSYRVAPNQSATSRSGAITIGEQSLSVTQAASPCSFEVSPLSRRLDSASGSFAIDVTATPSDCTWRLETATTWLTVVGPPERVGSGLVQLNYSSNAGPSQRAGAVTVAGRVVEVVQSAGSSAGTTSRYLAEGATSSFFDARLALLNPNAAAATATITFSTAGGAPVTTVVTVPPYRRVTVDPKTIPSLETAEFSTRVESDQPLVVDRTMSWDARGYGAHAETAVAAPALTWFLAEGATHSAFNLFYLLQNPNAAEARVLVRYLRPNGVPLEKTYTLPAQSRTNIWVDVEEIPGLGLALASTDVSAVVEVLNGQSIIVERAMYADVPGQTFGAGHESAGITVPATEWFLAEGATGPYFDLFVLVANPGSTDAQIEATYLLPDGTTVVKPYTVVANSRFNIWVDHDDPRLADTAVSTTIRSLNGVPIIVERAMWWPDGNWQEAHNSPGATTTGTRWALAEGEVDAARNLETYILIANTSTGPADVKVTLWFEDGTSAERSFAGIAGRSRFNVPVGGFFPEAAGQRFGATVESTGATPAQIVVERAMYWDAAGQRWAAGTNALGTKLQ